MNIKTIGILCALLTGCATKSEIAKFYNPSEPTLAQKPINPDHVKVVELASLKEMHAICKNKLGQESYRVLGVTGFTGQKVPLPELRKFAGSVGGDYLLRGCDFKGIKQGTRMVVGSYTPPSSSTSTGTSFGTASGTAYTNGITPFGAYNQTTYGSGSSYGTATATTFNPGQVTYVRENFEFPVFDQGIMVMQSPDAQKRNWSNMQTFLKINREGFELDPSKVATEEQVKKTSPAVQEMLNQIKAGRIFTPIEAQQFLVLHHQAQCFREASAKTAKKTKQTK